MDLLGRWRVSIAAIGDGHYDCNRIWGWTSLLISVVGIIVNVLTGSSLLTHQLAGRSEYLSLALGFAALFNAILIGIQGALKPSEHARDHLAAAVEAFAIVRFIDVFRHMPPEDVRQALDQTRARWDELQRKAPRLPKWLFKRHLPEIAHGLPPLNQGPVTQAPHTSA